MKRGKPQRKEVQKMENTKKYLTIDEKMDLIKERIYQAAFDEFDATHSEEELELMDEEDTYFENAYHQTLWTKGYENYTYDDIYNLPYKDIINIHNDIYECTLTLESVENTKLYWKGMNAILEK